MMRRFFIQLIQINMKTKLIFIFIITFLLISCSNNKKFSQEFITQFSGRYFYTLDEVIEVHIQQNNLVLKWRNHDHIKPMRFDDNVFYVKEMNQKIQFLINPTNQQAYICLIPKEKDKTIKFDYKKLNESEEVPSTYLDNKEYDKALTAYLALQKNEKASEFISENYFNKLGYHHLRNDQFQDAIEVFKINTALYPESSNVYDSLGDAYARNKDTLLAIENYKKTLSLDSGNRAAKRYLKKYDVKSD